MRWGPSEIRELRLRLGWSAAEMARRLGCSVHLVLTWEAGQNRPDVEVHRQFAFLQSWVEENSARITQSPLAEVVLSREHLAQVTNTVVAQFSKD